MSIYEVLSSYTQVETIIGLLAFIVAASLAYLAYINKAKLKSTEKIIKLADTGNKADLARSLMDAFPSYRIPDLTEKHGFEVIKMQYAQKATEFKSKMNTLRIAVVLLFLAIVGQFGEKYITYGKDSPIIHGDHNTINYADTAHKTSDSLTAN